MGSLSRFARLPFVVAVACATTAASGAEFIPEHYKLPFVASMDHCIRCHSNPLPPTRDKNKAQSRVTLVESLRWLEDDYHSEAFKVLSTPRALAMAKLMNLETLEETVPEIDKDGKDVEVKRTSVVSVRCISCHSGHYTLEATKHGADAPPLVTNVVEEIRIDGVSCQACHGPADAWISDHEGLRRGTETWWKKSSGEKYEFGLRDVRDPRSRAGICLSCHVGDSREGKILTHDMYAAGHPPLPNFEIETFMASMPYHGKRIGEKMKDSQPEWYREQPAEQQAFYRTKSMLASAMTAVELQVRLAGDEARWAAKAAGTVEKNAAVAPHWPELALFNCAACHHELETASWRQTRGYAGAPGRPMLRSWPTALYRAAGGSLATLQPLREAFARQPFGNPFVVANAGEQVGRAVDGEIQAFLKRSLDRTAAVALISKICAIGQESPPEYDDARQLAWALRIICDDLTALDEKAISADQQAALTAANSWFDKHLSLSLPDRQEKRTPLAVNQRSLAAALDYHPAEFQTQLKSIAAAFAAPAKR
jgi:hypothetical protein